MISCTGVQPKDLYMTKVLHTTQENRLKNRVEPDSKVLKTLMEQDAEVFDTRIRRNGNIIQQFLFVYRCLGFE